MYISGGTGRDVAFCGFSFGWTVGWFWTAVYPGFSQQKRTGPLFFILLMAERENDLGNDETNSKHTFFLLYDTDWELHKCIFVFVSWVSVRWKARDTKGEVKQRMRRGEERR